MSGIARGITYAEENLQVNQINEDLVELMKHLEGDYQTRAGLESESRDLNYRMELRKSEIINDRLSSTEESIAAHERAVKQALSLDREYQALMQRQNEVMAHRDVLSATISGRENNLKGHVARMNLLGGYLQFLSSLKEAETAAIFKASASPF